MPKPAPLRLPVVTSHLTAAGLLIACNAGFVSDLTVPKDWLPVLQDIREFFGRRILPTRKDK